MLFHLYSVVYQEIPRSDSRPHLRQIAALLQFHIHARHSIKQELEYRCRNTGRSRSSLSGSSMVQCGWSPTACHLRSRGYDS